MITVFGGIKGGSGKTTLSINLCVLKSLEGKRVLLVDADEQQSSLTWASHRESLGIPTDWTAISLNGASVSSQVKKMANDYDEIIIDVGGRDTTAQRAALVVADSFIIPFQPRSLDVWTLGKMSSLIDEALALNGGLIVSGVINRGDIHGKDNEEAQALIREQGNIKCLETIIYNRKIFANAATEGKGVIEMKPENLKATQEIKSLSEAVYGAILMLK